MRGQNTIGCCLLPDERWPTKAWHVCRTVRQEAAQGKPPKWGAVSKYEQRLRYDCGVLRNVKQVLLHG